MMMCAFVEKRSAAIATIADRENMMLVVFGGILLEIVQRLGVKECAKKRMLF
jgi:hypothetical protein